MNVLITGSSGLVGTALVPALRDAGHGVTRLLRRAARDGEEDDSGVETAVWDPSAGRLDPGVLAGHDAVVHLAGENLGNGRWSRERKRRIRDSRLRSTRLLAETLLQHRAPPPVLVSASAIGYYGDRGEQRLREDSIPGEGFLAEVCSRWEAAVQPAREKGLRVVSLRIGVVLAAHGGALARMLPLYRLGLGGRVGSGRQFVSWITRDDLVGVILHVLGDDGIQGPLNAVTPHPVRQIELARALGKVLGRPAVLPLPAFAARLVLGEMADELLLSSARVAADRLVDSGYAFRDPELVEALGRLIAPSP